MISILLLTLFSSSMLEEAPQPRHQYCHHPEGNVGDVVYQDCRKLTCIKVKKNKYKWISEPALDKCCSYEGVQFPPGREITKLWTSNGTEVSLFCTEGPTIAVSVAQESYGQTPDNLTVFEKQFNDIITKIEEVKTVVDANEAKLDLIPGKIEDVKNEVGANEAKLDLIPGKIEEVKTEVNAIEVKLDLIPGKIEEVKTEVDNTEAKLNLIPGKIEEVKNEVDANEAKIDLIPGKIEDVKSEVDANEAKIDMIPGKVEEVKNEVNANEAKLDLIPGKIEEVKTEVDVNEAKLDLIPGKIEGVKTEVDANEAKIDLIPGKIEEVRGEVQEVKEIIENIVPTTTATPTIEGILVAGGHPSLTTAEIFNPKSGRSCKIGDLPVGTTGLSLCGNLACGGSNSKRSCYLFEGTVTALSVTLREQRSRHLCWQLQSGSVLLLGGDSSKSTTERLSADGSSSTADFNLPYDISYACGIELNGNFIVTGGHPNLKTVAEFTETGQVTYLADLQEGRSLHACSKFVDNNGETALLVTGGYTAQTGRISSTEIYRNSQWSFAASLNGRKSGVRASTVQNSAYVSGGIDDAILVYNPSNDTWTEAGQFSEKKWHHASTTVKDVSQFNCV